MKKTITIHDIARMANVSSATVSRVLSNSTYPVSAAKREKILRIAQEVNYIPNLLGKQLKTNTSMSLGVIIPSITNPFYSSVILGIEEIARENQYQVLLCNSHHDPKLEIDYLQTIFEKQVKGLIISSISLDTKLLKSFIDMGLNVIALDQKIDAEGVCQIEFDYLKGGYMATSHLIARGHKKIGYVTAPLNRPSRISIHQGYLNAMQEHGLEPMVRVSEHEHVYDGIYEFDNGKRLTRELLDLPERPTAIFACNDMTAFGVINELANDGIQVPEDMSVIGFDGIEFGKMTTPPLTTIKQPDYEMGRLACKILLEMLGGGRKSELDMVLQPKLVERRSVARLGK
ncbi:LacI family DNA-binding transcriptional regulator [Paenibacillus sp. J2TS4]|uniref:LacI family DNA-binding transcriptional regulator n=1 Tax=Paenibacillus sp. J2TS4 TaxID=2807194 RepID=UPI001B137BD7|nr:LacI family DNA-binding transcriptional regulator [Paenibacillus sp. J2TS4]GIP34699.1 LacI family transcriptional regulator [Paenibacillus sp. J2TS4]